MSAPRKRQRKASPDDFTDWKAEAARLKQQIADMRVNEPYHRGLCEDFEILLPPHWHPGSTGSWLERLLQLRKAHNRMENAIRWALGETDDFPPREPGQGAFWWRTELRRRAGLTYTPPPSQHQ
jgi:hypothetical protein